MSNPSHEIVELKRKINKYNDLLDHIISCENKLKNLKQFLPVRQNIPVVDINCEPQKTIVERLSIIEKYVDDSRKTLNDNFEEIKRFKARVRNRINAYRSELKKLEALAHE